MQKGNQNSRIEVFFGVIRNLLDDIADLIESSSTLREARKLNPKRECDRDFKYLVSRSEHEGLSFLTSTLPRLGKWYDAVLAHQSGEIVDGFKPHHTFTCGFTITCPLFARMFSYVIHDPCGSTPEKARVIRAYRSLFYLLYKLEVPLTKEQLFAALQKWKDNESELDLHPFPSYYDSDLINARDIISDLISPFGETLWKHIVPAHGPGAVAGGEKNIDKWRNCHYIPSLHRVYPRYDYYFGFRSNGRISPTMCGEILNFVRSSTETEAVSRLLFVPKDSRGPRTISCEPKELMFLQQGVAKNLMKVLHSTTHGRINFVDQSINGHLALTSSKSRSFATIDLQDASDRVTTMLVDLMFPDWTHKYLHALRSTSTMLPDGSLFKDHLKYAPMGSALCFPIESCIFWALAVTAGINSGMTVMEAKADTYVYGDDIIIRPEVFPFLVRVFEKFALKVNISKSYVSGPFRESCGVDAWEGENITPFKIRKDLSRRSLDGMLASAVCEYSSKCFSLDLRRTGQHLYHLVESHYPGIPVVSSPIGCLCVVDESCSLSLRDQGFKVTFDTATCCLWVVGWVLSTPKTSNPLEGLSRLLFSYYGNWEEHDPSQVVVPRATKIRKRKTLVEGFGLA